MTEPSQDKLMPTEEMIEAGIGKAGEIQNAATSAEFVTAIYYAMDAARPTTDVSTDGLMELRERVRDFIYDCTTDDCGTGWTLSAHQTDDLIAMANEALQRSNAEKMSA